jgi:hypothetical protein
MAEPTTPAEQRRQGLHRARRVAAGVSVGAAVLLTGVIAGVNSAPSSSSSNPVQLATQSNGANGFQPAQPYQVSPQYTPQYPQTRTHGS